MTTSTEAQFKTLLNQLKLKTTTDTGLFHTSNYQKWQPYENSRWQNRKKRRQNQSTNNVVMVDNAKRDVVSESVTPT